MKKKICLGFILGVLIIGGITIWHFKKELFYESPPIKEEKNYYENDYYTNQKKVVLECQEEEKILEQESIERSIKNNEYEPYSLNFYSDKKEILDIKGIFQEDDTVDYSEAISISLLLKYFGIDIDYREFANQLTISPVYEKNGEFFGPNPTTTCVSIPSSNKFSNCFSNHNLESGRAYNKLHETTNNAFHGKQRIQVLAGMNLNYTIPDIPAVIWVGKNYEEASEVYEWWNEEKTEKYTYPKNAQAVLLVGYDKNHFYILDSLKSENIIRVERAILEKSYNSYGRQVFVVDRGRYGLYK